MNIKEYYKPASLEEAYGIFKEKDGTIIGGGVFLHLGEREIKAAVDLSRLNLDYISEEDGFVEIGAMTTIRKVETSEVINGCFDGVLAKAAGTIMGVQIRNMATIGGTVSGRYGFSDLLTVLLALDAGIRLYKHGDMKLEKYLESNISDDILTSVYMEKTDTRAAFNFIKSTSTDFSILNCAVSRADGKFRICMGARPGLAKVAGRASDFMSTGNYDEENAAKAGEIAAESLEFGSDMRGSSSYRKELCKTLVKRAIMEVVR